MANKQYEIIIGLEVHLQPLTKSKMFCGCSTDYFGKPPNSHTCPVCLGLPGALPVPNKVSIEKCIMLSLALGCKINQETKFDRKNYFYPDLPKGFQISQYDKPIGYKGNFNILTKTGSKVIGITRIHQEEDTGKSIHEGNLTLLDYNKSGMPLIELVTEPDLRSSEEVTALANNLQQIVRYLNISNADMEKGQMRFEINMSLRHYGETTIPNYKVEVKNIGSISVLRKVIDYEYKRQSQLLNNDTLPIQETRGLIDMTGKTRHQRIKETSADYRYFPSPDIPPIILSDNFIKNIKARIGELPEHKRSRYINDYHLDNSTVEIIIATKERAEWYENAIINYNDKKIFRDVANWLVGDVLAILNKHKKRLSDIPFKPKFLSKLVALIHEGVISNTIAKKVFNTMYQTGLTPKTIIDQKSLTLVSDHKTLEKIALKVISDNPKIVTDILKNPNAIQALVGQIMKITKGQANPKEAFNILSQIIKNI